MKYFKSLLIIVIVISLIAILGGCKSANFTSAKLYLQQENYPKAIEFLEKEISVNPANDEAHYLLGYCYGRNSRFTEMNEQFTAALAISGKFTNDIGGVREKYWIDHFNAGIRKLKDEQLEGAIEDFNVANVINPNKAANYQNLAYAYIKLDDHEKAIEIYLKALEIEPDATATLLTLGMEYYLLKQYPECIETMGKILKLDPEHKEAISYTALCYDLMGEGEKALAAYDDALAKNPDDGDLYFNRGRLFYMRDDYERASQDFQKVAELSPDDFQAVYNLGNTYLSIGDSVQKKIKTLVDQSDDENKIKALQEDEKKYLELAKKYLLKAKELNSDHQNLWYNLGVVYVRLGDAEKGKAAFDKSDEIGEKKQ